jgi:hypothetical protein
LAITVLIVSPFLILALSDSKLARQPFAQVTAAPGPVVVPAPFAPGAPQAFSTIGALPSLAAAPGFTPFAAAASVAPTPRVFRCTCGAPGTWTEWAGVVSSSNFLLASQAARSVCATFLLNQNAQSPDLVPEGTTPTNQHFQIYNGTAFTQRAQVSTSVGQNVILPRSSVTQLTTECSRCACN